MVTVLQQVDRYSTCVRDFHGTHYYLFVEERISFCLERMKGCVTFR